MKNLDFHKVCLLSRLQMSNLKTLFGFRFFCIGLFIVGWPLLVNGEILTSVATSVRWVFLLVTVYFPFVIILSFIAGFGHQMLLPTTALEKYVSMWLTSFALVLVGILVMLTSVLSIYAVLAVTCFDTSVSALFTALGGKHYYSTWSFAWAVTSSGLLFGLAPMAPVKPLIPLGFLCLCLLAIILGLLFFLPSPTDKIAIAVFCSFITLGFLIYGYRYFKVLNFTVKA